MNIDTGEIQPYSEVLRSALAGDPPSRWTQISDDELETMLKTEVSKRSSTLSKMRGHLPPEKP